MAPAVGELGARVASEVDEPEVVAQASPRSRISGRVLDAKGLPVADASVRLADGRARGGRDIRTSTDRSGAFTLSGLQPGLSYTLIAETEDEKGRQRGSAEATSAETGVEINLSNREGETAKREPRPSRARPVSNRAKASDEKTNLDEDAEPLPEAADSAPQEVSGDRRKASAVAGSPWRKVGSSGDATTGELSPRSSQQEKTRQSEVVTELEDEGPNPLPPAIDRGSLESDPVPLGEESSPRDQSSTTGEPIGGLVLAPNPSSDVIRSGAETGPPSLGDEGPKPAVAPPDMPTVASATPSPGLSTSSPPGVEQPSLEGSSKPASEPVFASEGPKPFPASTPQDYNPFANPFVTQASAETVRPPARVTARPKIAGSVIGMDIKPRTAPSARVQASEPAVPKPSTASAPAVPPARKMTWGELARSKPVPTVDTAVAQDSASPPKTKSRSAPATVDATTSLCVFDSRLGKITDFRLPDLEGKPVSLKDLDADLILLDFWGTWCKPCVEAVPHLVELQKKFGPGRLAIVGIACEEVDPKLRRAKVEEMSRKLGINYAVLLSGMDGPCPLRDALHVQALPTMIVLDRTGKIQWRVEGATVENLERLDRVVAASAGRGNTVRR